MQYDEHYLVEEVSPEGKTKVEKYTDPFEALAAYEKVSGALVRGAKVQLHRTTDVVMASSVRAR